MKMYTLDWSERIGLKSFADQFQELTRKMTAAGDGTPERSHVTRLLCLLPPRFANTVSYITRESRDATKFATMWSVLEELKLDDERQQLSNPSLRKNADRSDDALNATVNGECHYCHKPGHFRRKYRRRQTDEAKGVERRSVQDKPHGNSGGRGGYDGGRGGGHFSGRGYRLVALACTRGVRLADGHPIPVTAMGNVKIKSEETGRTATFKNVLYVPSLKKTLVSIRRINLQSGDASLVFKRDHCQLRNKNKLSITAKWNDSYLYAIQGNCTLPGMDDEANMAETAEAMLWHARMGHIPAGSMTAASKASFGGPTNLPKANTCERRIRLNDLGPISKLLGMEIDRDESNKSMYVTQRTYIERMAIKYGIDKSNRVDTPIPAGTSMVDNAGF
ncbi:hypothetical protein DYB28_001161, partial [Aphanomyces astaci]